MMFKLKKVNDGKFILKLNDAKLKLPTTTINDDAMRNHGNDGC